MEAENLEARREQDIVRARIKLLELALQLGNVSLACQRLGYSRDSFYRFKKLYEEGGTAALTPVSRRKPLLKNRIPLETEKAVMSLAVHQPEWSQVQVSRALKARHMTISPSGVRYVWLRWETDNLKSFQLQTRDASVCKEMPWFTPTDAARIIAADGRLSKVPNSILDTIANNLTNATENFQSHIISNVELPPYVGPVRALRRLASAARTLANRLAYGRSISRQVVATIRAHDSLPNASSMALSEAASTECALHGGRRVAVVVDIISSYQSNYGLEARQLAFAAATDLETWAMHAAKICPRKHPELVHVSAAVRAFALDVMCILHRDAGLLPVQVRRTHAQSEPGSPSGPTFRALEAFFFRLRAAWSAQSDSYFRDHYNSEILGLHPGPETLFEWIRTAQGKPRRLRGKIQRDHRS